ncbi:MAG: DUF2837 family protein [Thermacetogeniaceae bacterium]
MDRIQLVILLTAIIHLTDTLFYAVRLSGVKTRRLITAFSLFQLIALLAGVANMIQAPLLSAIVEQGINSGQIYYQAHMAYLLGGIRLIILASSVGTVAAAVITPVFIFFMNRAVFVFERTGSLLQLFLLLLSPARLARLSREFTAIFARRLRQPRRARYGGRPFGWMPRRRSILRSVLRVVADLIFRGRPLPLGLFLVHIVVVSIWTNGVLAALYAGALMPSYRSTASMLSGVVNGIAAVLATFLIDPVTAVITDQSLQGLRDERDIVALTYWLMFTRLLGTILAQVIFIPTAHLVEWLTLLMT